MKVSQTLIETIVQDMINEGFIPEYVTQDDCGLEAYEYVEFVREVLDRIEART